MASTLSPPRLYVQPLPNRQQTRTLLGAQSFLLRSGRQARSCPACCTLQTDAPGCSENPVPPVRYTGVSPTKGGTRYQVYMRYQGKARYIGSSASPGEAASMYDEACIFVKKDPVNFPRSQYDEAAILQYADLGAFITAKRTPKDTSSRFSGVSRSSGKNGKWISRCRISGHDHPLGSYSTEELAAQAHDKVLIYQGLGTKNFPEASYDVDSIYLQESIGSLMASIRAKAAALTKAHQTSRFSGVYRTSGNSGKWGSCARIKGQSYHIGNHITEELAAQAYDKVRIYQGVGATNFPEASYDVDSIYQQKSVGSLVASIKAEALAVTKAHTTSRFFGAHPSNGGKSGKWSSSAMIKGHLYFIGNHLSEEHAAQAYDKVRIYQGLGVRNFPEATYDVESIYQQESIDSLFASIKAEASALSSAQFTSRYIGVYHGSKGTYDTIACMPVSDCRLGHYIDEAQAAMAYDHFCIYQGRAPRNFPDHPYNVEEICRPASLSEFVHQSRENASRLVKLRQSSRYTGVSWETGANKWAAYVVQGGRKVHLGLFGSEKEAARLVDQRRHKLGQDTVNFPLRSRQTAVSRTWPDEPSKQTKT